jgi:hypothetical protein
MSLLIFDGGWTGMGCFEEGVWLLFWGDDGGWCGGRFKDP